jgi:hypothetical protein
MRPSTRLTASLLSASALLLAVSTPAHAQLGKLKKMGADAIKDAAKGKLGNKDTTSTSKPGAAGSAAAAASGNAKAPTRAPNYTITAERIELVMTSLRPLVADAEKQLVLRRTSADYKAKREAALACFNKASSNVNPMALMNQSEAQQKRAAAMQAQAEAVNKRLNASRDKSNSRAKLALQDTADVMQMNMAAVSIGSSCTMPYAPLALIDAQASANANANASNDADGSDESGTLDPTPEAKQALTRAEFGMLRERIALWLMAQTNPSLQKGSEGKFTAEENAAMSAKAAELTGLAPLFSSSALRWSTWGDVKAW